MQSFTTSLKGIHEVMMVTGENALSYSMVKKWDAEFKHGKDRQETVAKSHDIVMADR